MSTEKHAFLIIAHGDFPLLQKSVSLIDHERADIYIHVDKKAGALPEIRTERSKVHFIKQMDVCWGDFSLVQCELNLFKAAASNEKYDYYHLISGADLPIVSKDIFYSYFDSRKGENFISFDSSFNINSPAGGRVKYYHCFLGLSRSPHLILRLLPRALQKLQALLKVNRLKNIPFQIYNGAGWFSITDSLVRYALENEAFIKKHFNHTLCSDEMYLHTIAMNSPFKETVTGDSKRYIDWSEKKYSPKTLTMADKDKILSSNCFFARKFSTKDDSRIIEEIMSITSPTHINA